MKKLYTIALAAAVALSASAQYKAPKGVAESGLKNVQIRELAKNATAERNIATIEHHNTTAVKHAPSKAAATNMAELLGAYDYSIVVYTNAGAQQLKNRLTIAEGTEENEVILQGLRYSDVDVKGTVDFTAGTITCKPQLL
ncbi:MAG: hypothetical protein K2G07_09770, partial [Muribaculaceae bacterium]|nr:hypothetical protein [Muribaculaceae bacterium]